MKNIKQLLSRTRARGPAAVPLRSEKPFHITLHPEARLNVMPGGTRIPAPRVRP